VGKEEDEDEVVERGFALAGGPLVVKGGSTGRVNVEGYLRVEDIVMRVVEI
jgi:hypothetical protein